MTTASRRNGTHRHTFRGPIPQGGSHLLEGLMDAGRSKKVHANADALALLESVIGDDPKLVEMLAEERTNAAVARRPAGRRRLRRALALDASPHRRRPGMRGRCGVHPPHQARARESRLATPRAGDPVALASSTRTPKTVAGSSPRDVGGGVGEVQGIAGSRVRPPDMHTSGTRNSTSSWPC